MPKKTKEELRAGRIIAAQRRKRCVEMRIIGATYETIGETLGIAKSNAFWHVKKALQEIAKEENAAAEVLRALELRKLDALSAASWKALYARRADPSNPQGPRLIDDTKIDPQVAAVILRCIRERSRLLGLYQQGEVGEGHAGGIESLLIEVDKMIVIAPPQPPVDGGGDNGAGNGSEPLTIDVEPSP